MTARDSDVPTRIGEVLDRTLRRMGAPGSDALTVVFDEWASVVGADAASGSRPVSLSEGRLVVVARDPAWASQLRWSVPTILERIEARLGAGVVGDVVVRVDPDSG